MTRSRLAGGGSARGSPCGGVSGGIAPRAASVRASSPPSEPSRADPSLPCARRARLAAVAASAASAPAAAAAAASWCVGGRVRGRGLYGVRLYSLLAGRLGRSLSRLAPKPSQQVKTPSVMSRARRPAPETGRSARCEIDMDAYLRARLAAAGSSQENRMAPAAAGPGLGPPRPDCPQPLREAGQAQGSTSP